MYSLKKILSFRFTFASLISSTHHWSFNSIHVAYYFNCKLVILWAPFYKKSRGLTVCLSWLPVLAAFNSISRLIAEPGCTMLFAGNDSVWYSDHSSNSNANTPLPIIYSLIFWPTSDGLTLLAAPKRLPTSMRFPLRSWTTIFKAKVLAHLKLLQLLLMFARAAN